MDNGRHIENQYCQNCGAVNDPNVDHGDNHVDNASNINHGTIHGVLNQIGVQINQTIACTCKHQVTSDPKISALLGPIADASYERDRQRFPPDSDCFPGTREKPIQSISQWANSRVWPNTHIPHVYWTHGYAGCGKSSISQAISQKYGRNGRLLASFFFYRGTGDRSTMIRFATTLASQMVAVIPDTEQHVKAALDADSGLLKPEASLKTQLTRLVFEPFRAVAKGGSVFKSFFQRPFLVVIDGLDECEEKAKVKEFIECLLAFFEQHPSCPLRFFITSRVEQHIQVYLKPGGVKMDDLIAYGSDDDIITFLETSFSDRAKTDVMIKTHISSTGGSWPTKDDMRTLVRHIGGSFIFASVLFKFIVEPSGDDHTPMTRLPLTLKMNPGLDGLYADTLARSRHLTNFSDMISTLTTLFEPLSVIGIAELLDIQTSDVARILVDLQAIIHVPGTDESPITFCHTSLRDFLTSKKRSKDLFVSPSYHYHLSYRCLALQYTIQPASGTTAAVAYSVAHLAEHIKLCPDQAIGEEPFEDHLRLLRPDKDPGQIFDAIYSRILSRSEHLPHFLKIVSTIALVSEPLPVAALSELINTEISETRHVLKGLQTIIVVSEGGLITLRHPSLRGFLTTKRRSGPFFAAPTDHLYLSFRWLRLSLTSTECSQPTAATSPQDLVPYPPSLPPVGRSIFHWSAFTKGGQLEASATIERLTESYGQYRHVFLFVGTLQDSFFDQSAPRYLNLSLDYLAQALECEPEPGWLDTCFWPLVATPDPPKPSDRVFGINGDDASLLQTDLRRAIAALKAKCPDKFRPTPSTLNANDVLRLRLRPNDWTPMVVLNIFQWVVARIENLENDSGDRSSFELHMSTWTGTYTTVLFSVIPRPS